MKKISTRLVIALFSVQLTLVYVLLGIDTLSETYPAFVFALIPVVVVLGLGIWQLDILWQRYDSLHIKMKETGKNIWFWILLCISTGLMIGMMYYGSQLLLPEIDPIYSSFFGEDIHTHLFISFGCCTILYINSIRWMYNTLKNIWKD